MNKQITVPEGSKLPCQSCTHAISHTTATIVKKAKVIKRVLFTYGCPPDCRHPEGKTYITKKEGTLEYPKFYGYRSA